MEHSIEKFGGNTVSINKFIVGQNCHFRVNLPGPITSYVECIALKWVALSLSQNFSFPKSETELG